MSDSQHNEDQGRRSPNLDDLSELRNGQTVPEAPLKDYNISNDKLYTSRSRKVSFNEGIRQNKQVKNRKAKTNRKKGSVRSSSAPSDDIDVPYDRGWAWMVDFGYFILFFVYISHDNWHSVLLLDYLKEFDISVSVVTIMLSLGSLCYCVSTQISTNVLVVKYSTRNVVTIAAIINFLATLLFAAAPNIATFFVANMIKYSAKGITLIATMILIGFYFKRRRGLATTLGLLGMSTAYICAPPLIRYVREEFGFRGCFLIMAGLEMHGVAAALLLRPFSNYRRKRVNPELADVEMEEIHSFVDKISNHQSEDSQPIEEVEQLFEVSPDSHSNIKKPLKQNGHQEDVNSSGVVTSKLQSDFSLDVATDSALANGVHNVQNDKRNLNYQSGNEDDITRILRQNAFEDNNDVVKSSELDNLLTDNSTERSERQSNSTNTAAAIAQEARSQSNISVNYNTHEHTILKAQGSTRHFHHSTIAGLRRTAHASNWSLVTTSTMGSTLNIPLVIETQLSEDEDEPQEKPKRFQWLRDLFDLSLLKNYIAVMVVVMYILINASSFSVVYLPTYAKREGVSSTNAAILLTIVGAMDIVGRLFFGFLADLKIVRPHIIVALSSACIGTVTHFIVLLDSFEKLIFFAVMHGFLAGAGHNLTTVLIIDVMGLQYLSKLLSVASMFNSFSFIIQHPIHGALIQTTGTFAVTYHYIGTCLILACVLLLCEPCIRKLQVAKEKRQELEQASTNGI